MKVFPPSSLGFVFGFVFVFACGATAAAQEERELSVPVDSPWRVQATASELQGLVRHGFRIHDLELASTSPLEFSAVLVRNTGPYQRTWAWWSNRTFDQLSSDVAAYGGRLIDIETYEVNGTRLWAGVAVHNSGAAQKVWHRFVTSSTTTLSTYLGNANARIVDLDSYLEGRLRVYVALAIENTGADARSWWWYVGQTQAQVEALLVQNAAEAIDIERNGTDSFDVVMVRPPSRVNRYRYYDVAENEIVGRLSQHGGRLIDLEQHGTGLTARYDIVLADNTQGFGTFGTGCAGTAGVLTYFGAGLPALGGSIAFGIQNGPQSQIGVALVGGSNTQWSGLPLPIPLAAFGAPGCSLLVAPDVMLPTFVNGAGRTVSIPIPVLPQLVGGDVFSQFLCPDPGANALGLITSAGVIVRIRA